jgi:protein-tyrosine phosphatase
MTPSDKPTPPLNSSDDDDVATSKPNDYNFIFAQPEPSKQKSSLKDRFLALSKAKQVAIVAGICVIILFAAIIVIAIVGTPSTANRQTVIGTADTNGDGVIDKKDHSTATDTTNDDTTTDANSSDDSTSSDDVSWWQRLLAISNNSSGDNSADDSTSTTADSGEISAANDEDSDAAITDNSYTDDSDEATPVDTAPAETEVNDPVDTTSDPTPTAKDGTLLTIGSWNILYLNNASRVTTGIKTILGGAQVVGLQEVGTNGSTANRNAIKNLASGNVGVYQPDGSTPIVWNAKMYTKKASGYKKISAYGVVKYATYVKLRNKATGQEFYVFNFHAVVGTKKPSEGCSTNVCKAYKYEMKALSKFIASKKSDNLPVFVTGDYNADYRFDYTCSLSWYPCSTFRSMTFRSGYDYTGGLSRLGKSDSSVGSASTVIDYVFSWQRSDVSPISMQIIAPTASCSTDKSGQKHCWNGSDHKPVFFTVGLKQDNSAATASEESTTGQSNVASSSSSGTTITLAGVTNFRDASATSSGLMKSGVLYRSARLQSATTSDRSKLAAILKNGAILDLRTSGARKSNPDGAVGSVNNSSFPVDSTDGSKVGKSTSDMYVQVFVNTAADRKQLGDAITKIANTPGNVLVHCTAGKDRTGWLVAMIMYAIGANDTQVMTEYTRSNAYGANVDSTWLNTALTAAKKKNNGSILTYIQSKSAGLGVDDATIAKLKTKLSAR